MSDTILIKTGVLGSRAEMPKLQYDAEKGSEIGYRTDTNELYIGTSEGNKRLCGAGDVTDINARIDEIDASIAGIKGDIANIIARLDALETPSV